MRRTALVLLFLSIARTASADPRAMTLDEAVEYAKKHQPEMKAAVAKVNAAKAAADVPSAQWKPTFGVTAQIFAMTANNTTGTYVGVPGLDIPRIGGTRGVSSGSFEPYAATIVAAGGNQEVFDFGRIAAQSAAADARIDVERENAKTTDLDVTFAVQESYYAVLAAKSILKSSSDAVDRSRAHRDQAKAGVDSGLRTPIELTRAEADLARFEIGRTKAEGGVLTAQGVFAATVGVADASLDASGTPKEAADLPALEGAISEASNRDPEIRSALAKLRAEELKTKAIGAENRPDLSLTASLSGRAGGAPPSGNGEPAKADGFLPNVANWDAGLVLSWPLFDSTISARQEASRAQEEVRRQELDVVRTRQVAMIRQAYVAADVARRALPGLQRAVEAAQANYAQADARFKGGLGTSVELADAEALRTDAEIQLALGRFQLARARASFGRTISEGSR